MNSPQTIHRREAGTSHEEINTGSQSPSRRGAIRAETREKRGGADVRGEPVERETVERAI